MAQTRARRQVGRHATINRMSNTKVRWLDGSALDRPLDMPPNVRMYLVVTVLIAAIIGAYIIYLAYDMAVNAPQREQQLVQANIARQIDLNLPNLSELIFMDDQTALNTLMASGAGFYEISPIGQNPRGGFEVLKLPDDVSLEEAAALYAQGIDNISASQAARLLNGAWIFTFIREGNTSVRVRYGDFDATSLEEAMQNALAAEGLTDAPVRDSGVDDAGNTFQTGEIDLNGTVCTWRVSIVPLTEVYDIGGFPDNIYYVGIRYTI